MQDFIPAPFDIATCMWYTGVDPMSGKPVEVARHLRDRKLQRALMQFFKPENWFEVREALVQAGRTDLMGSGCDALIPASAPKEALEARRKKANLAVRGDHYHSVANPGAGRGSWRASGAAAGDESGLSAGTDDADAAQEKVNGTFRSEPEPSNTCPDSLC